MNIRIVVGALAVSALFAASASHAAERRLFGPPSAPTIWGHEPPPARRGAAAERPDVGPREGRSAAPSGPSEPTVRGPRVPARPAPDPARR